MDQSSKGHETQPEKPIIDTTNTYSDDLISGYQKIEAGGPIKKIDFKAMPTPVRYFGYFFITFVILAVITLIGISVLK